MKIQNPEGVNGIINRRGRVRHSASVITKRRERRGGRGGTKGYDNIEVHECTSCYYLLPGGSR